MATNVHICTLQKGLTVLGHDPQGVDGYDGEDTEAAIMEWIDARRARGLTTEVRDGAAGTFDILPDAAAQELLTASGRYTGTPTRLCDPTSAEAQGHTSSPSHPTTTTTHEIVQATQMFWRRSNPWAWALVLIPIVSALGYFGYRAYKKH